MAALAALLPCRVVLEQHDGLRRELDRELRVCRAGDIGRRSALHNALRLHRHVPPAALPLAVAQAQPHHGLEHALRCPPHRRRGHAAIGHRRGEALAVPMRLAHLVHLHIEPGVNREGVCRLPVAHDEALKAHSCLQVAP